MWIEGVAITALAALVFVVHPYGNLTHHPYWADESWVALLSTAPLSRWIGLSSSTPLGWLLIVHAAPVNRDSLRIVPLLFAAGDVVMAYLFVRSLPWKSAGVARFTGTIAGAAVLLAPISLIRNDLKQYTADAFFTLAVVTLASRAEAHRSRTTLVQLVVASLVAVVFSTVTAFVVVAVMAALVIVELTRRTERRIRDVLLAAGATAVAIGIYFALVIVPHDSRALRDYWRSSYLTGGLPHELVVAWQRFTERAPRLAMPTAAVVVLLAVGAFVLVRFKRRALALTVLLLWVEMIAVGVLGRYPFLDQRTSHFLLVFSLTIAALGAAGLIVASASISRLLAVLLTVVAAVSFWRSAEPYVRRRTIPNEDVRSQVEYVARHRRADDVIVVSLQSSYAFGYYWPGAVNSFSVDHTGHNSNGYTSMVTNLPGVEYAHSARTADTIDAIRRAVTLARSHAGAGRIWVIRTHYIGPETRAWRTAFDRFGLQPRILRVGMEPLLEIDLSPPPST